MSLDEALQYVEEWLEWESVWVPQPTERHGEVFARLLRQTNRPRLVSDAHVAAIAIEHDLTLCSADHDMRMFPGLKIHNPLQ
jgi:predicted nucleic acid-binding protein